MSVPVYTIGENDVIHPTKIDLVRRDFIPKTIHIIQYDSTLPIIEVELNNNGSSYTLPDDADVKLRWPDIGYNQPVYKPVLGCSSDKTKLYFAVDERMTSKFGDVVATLEIILNESFTDSDDIVYEKRIGSTSPIYFNIEKNPIQKSDFNYPTPSEFPSDGVYVLEATVENGVVTYNWVLKS